MITINPYRSNTYPSYDKARSVANNLSRIDGNKYEVHFETINGDTVYFFDNKEDLTVQYRSNPSDPLPSLFLPPKYIRQPILDYVESSERIYA